MAREVLSGVVEGQRWGASAAFGPAAPSDDYGLKNGWYPALTGWRVNSVAISFGEGLEPMVFVGLTRARESFESGVETIERIAQRLGTVLYGTPVEALPSAGAPGASTALERFAPDPAGLPSVEGSCDAPSRTVHRDGALACHVGGIEYDPCFVGSDSLDAVCNRVRRDPVRIRRPDRSAR
jgi:hypothetical protein